MPIPEHILSVERPKNTVVTCYGKNKDHYAVRQRVGCKYDEGRQEVDSIQNSLKIAVALTFKADGKMSMKIDSETNGEADTQQMDGTYQFDGKKVILSYDNQQDTLVLQADGNELFGRIDENTFSSTLKRTK